MRRTVGTAALLALMLPLVTPARAEVIEEVVAWVNGEVITLSDYREEEETVVGEAYRRYTGEELDQQLERLKKGLLLRLIDRKILVDSAQRLYDMKRMGDVFLDGFKDQQNIHNDEELKRMLEQEGMTLDELKVKLVEMFAPEEVLRFEVTSRVFVTDEDVETFYKDNADRFLVPAEATLREIVLRVDESAGKQARRDEAKAIRQRLASGEDFAEVAREVSEAGTRGEGGLVGTLKISELSEALRGPATNLPIGEISEVIEGPRGLHIIRVESRTEDHLTPMEEVQDQIRRYLQDRKLASDTEAFLTKARNESEWCVKTKFKKLLSIPAPTSCHPE